MGMIIPKLIIETSKSAVKQANKIASAESSVFITKPSSINAGDSFLAKIPEMFRPLSKKEIAEIKPSEFKKLLESRKDIPKEITEVSWNDGYLHVPEQLSLYDKINNILITKNINSETRKKILLNIIQQGPENAEAQGKVLPKLIEKGYDIELLSHLQIDEFNAPFVEKLIKRKDLYQAKALEQYEKEVWCAIDNASINPETWEEIKLNEKQIEKIKEQVRERIPRFQADEINKFLKHINSENFKYIDECLNTTGNINLIKFWNKDSAQIYKKYLANADYRISSDVLEVISRRKHDLKSVEKIFENGEINSSSYRLLEFKNFDKYKDISLDNFNTLTNSEKKEFINSYITAISIGNAMWPSQSNVLNNYAQLCSKMKIFKHLDAADNKTFLKSYSETLKKMMDTLPKEERLPIYKKINYGEHSAKYRAENPIPAMCDDLTKLPARKEIINGKEFLVSEISKKNDLVTSAHRIPNGDAILNCEALEFTDPNEILCLGLNGAKKGLNSEPKGYSLAIKPRLGNDWWIQAHCDIDSGNDATKNIKNVGKFFKGSRRHYAYIPELIKKELDLSTKEYSERMKKLANCTTLDEIAKLDKEMEIAIRKVLENNRTFEGIIRPETMGIIVGEKIPLSEINPNILDYVENRGIRLIKVVSE